MRWTSLLTAVLISTGSCSPFGSVPTGGRPVGEVYERGDSAENLRFLSEASPLSREKQVPVILPPEIFPVFVPTHVDPERDILVGEHYLFMKLQEATWFSERLTEVDPRVDTLADPRELAPLADTPWEKAIVPHKAKP